MKNQRSKIAELFFSRIPAKFFIFLIRCYQLILSPFFSGSCRFFPSCSTYAIEAFEQHGLVSGMFLTIKRLLRCHPWCEGGIDPVPENVKCCCEISDKSKKNHK